MAFATSAVGVRACDAVGAAVDDAVGAAAGVTATVGTTGGTSAEAGIVKVRKTDHHSDRRPRDDSLCKPRT
jgi:hypothetical protein